MIAWYWFWMIMMGTTQRLVRPARSTWLVVVLTYLLLGQLPNFAMAPYLGNLQEKMPSHVSCMFVYQF